MCDKYVIGIDPGKNGGIAILRGDGVVTDVCAMPDTAHDLLQLLREYASYGDCVCYLEKVGGMPGNGASAMFSFGRGFGHIEMCLLALCIPTTEVIPQKWQRYFGVGGSSITKSSAVEKREHKNKLKFKCQQLFPDLGKRITLRTCDALLIAYYGLKHDVR